jgi:hypothetical protein
MQYDFGKEKHRQAEYLNKAMRIQSKVTLWVVSTAGEYSAVV